VPKGVSLIGWLAFYMFASVSGLAAKPQESPQTQTQAPEASKGGESNDQTKTAVATPGKMKSLGERLLEDQKQILTSPGQLRIPDAGWLLPMAGFSSMLFVTDAQFSRHLSNNPGTISHYKTLSDAGVAALVGTAGGLWLMSFPTHNSHWRETGFLSGEAALNSLLDVEALKYSLGRERPYQNTGNGDFFHPGDTSFPSEHAAVAFAVAGVIAHEYPGPIPKILAYGLATAVSISRVKAKQHFNSDVFVGSVMGDMIAQNVYSRHYDPELGGVDWQSMSQFFREHWKPSPKSFGSPFVPLDSWIYTAMDRLTAMGFLKSTFAGIKPWTRLECTTLYEEAAESVEEKAPELREANRILDSLRTEFTPELREIENDQNESLRLESVYTRATGIEGTPLNDSYHFGQTLINDDGRPYEEGFNNSTGFSAYATENRFALYVSGEYQHAPSAPAFTLEQREIIATVDQNPVLPATPVAETNQFVLEDTYVATNIEGWNMTFGKQSLWWGPAYGSAFLYSNNAAPAYMFQLGRTSPFLLPFFLRYLGPAKFDFFFGRTQGNSFPGRPLIHGVKLSFKPTENLELGFSATSEFGGIGRPMTPKAIFNSFFAFSSSVNYGPSDNPGKRNSGFDFTYRVPFLRNWLTLYVASMAPDDPSPLDAPRRAAVNPGIYMPRFPRISWLDLRLEAVSTETPARDPSLNSMGGAYIYWEQFYHDLYTTKGNIFGSWIGREGKGYQAWSTIHFSARNYLQFGYRHAEVASDFIPRGEAINDGSVSWSWWITKEMSFSGLLQYEKWNVPVLASTPQTDWTSSVQITFWPRAWR
jgi:membrane-associated phospholipid phosphatase